MTEYPRYKHRISYLIKDKSSREVQILLREIEIWSRQRKLNLKVDSDQKGIFILFEQPDDATLFSLLFGTRRVRDYPVPHRYSPPIPWHSSFTSPTTTKREIKITW